MERKHPRPIKKHRHSKSRSVVNLPMRPRFARQGSFDYPCGSGRTSIASCLCDTTRFPKQASTACETSSLSILRTSKLISDEALNVLYGSNIFLLRLIEKGSAGASAISNLTMENRDRVRQIEFMIEPQGLYFGLPIHLTLEPELWSYIFKNLTQLLVVVWDVQRECSNTRHNAFVRYERGPWANVIQEDEAHVQLENEEYIELWNVWLNKFFKYLRKQIPAGKEGILQLDTNHRTVERAFLEYYFPRPGNNYRDQMVRTRLGDNMFKRVSNKDGKIRVDLNQGVFDTYQFMDPENFRYLRRARNPDWEAGYSTDVTDLI